MCRAIGAMIGLQDREAKILGLDRAPTPKDEFDNLSDAELYELSHQWVREYRTDD